MVCLDCQGLAYRAHIGARKERAKAMIPRYGERVRPAMRYKQRPGAYAILLRGRDILLTYQAGIHNEFQLPGGGIDAGEHPIPALHREVHEETGWGMEGARRVGAFRHFAYMPEYDTWAEKICSIYLARTTVRRGPPLEPEHSAVWVPAPLAADLLASEGCAVILRRVLGGR